MSLHHSIDNITEFHLDSDYDLCTYIASVQEPLTNYIKYIEQFLSFKGFCNSLYNFIIALVIVNYYILFASINSPFYKLDPLTYNCNNRIHVDLSEGQIV